MSSVLMSQFGSKVATCSGESGSVSGSGGGTWGGLGSSARAGLCFGLFHYCLKGRKRGAYRRGLIMFPNLQSLLLESIVSLILTALLGARLTPWTWPTFSNLQLSLRCGTKSRSEYRDALVSVQDGGIVTTIDKPPYLTPVQMQRSVVMERRVRSVRKKIAWK